MDFNLILTAQTLVLAPHLRESEPVHGVLVLKNIPAKTYLRVTEAQWLLLKQFREPRTVPAVLGFALEERVCLPLNEFFELILKAVKANILLEPNVSPPDVSSTGWRASVRPQSVARPLILLFFAGLAMTLAFRPQLPATMIEVGIGLLILSVALSLGSLLAACILRGAGGEVYRPRLNWRALPPRFEIDRSDSAMVSVTAQQAISMSRPAILAAATGLIAWHRPEWNLLPLIGLAVLLRPIFGGRIAGLFRLGRRPAVSDAEHDFIFPPNLRPRARVALLVRAVTHPETWVKVAYGVVWTLSIIYLAGRLTETPPWTIAFWQANGLRIAVSVGGSLAVLTTGYICWELYRYLRERARNRRRRLRIWYARWFGSKKIDLDEGNRTKAVASSPLFRALPPPERQALARFMQPARHKSRQWLAEYSGNPTDVGLIVSGMVGLYRVLPSGRTQRVQVLGEGDVIGLHDLADPEKPEYRVRTLTPVTLLTINRVSVQESFTERLAPETLANLILKLPFLRRISLCRNWHLQAIERFAQLSTITDCAPESVIVAEGQPNQYFFVIFEQDAVVTRAGNKFAIIKAGEFFGEIGLLQNSTTTAGILARQGTRCLCIPRRDFLRFVTHNHTIALELERVSSARIGRPIFPLSGGNFRSM